MDIPGARLALALTLGVRVSPMLEKREGEKGEAVVPSACFSTCTGCGDHGRCTGLGVRQGCKPSPPPNVHMTLDDSLPPQLQLTSLADVKMEGEDGQRRDLQTRASPTVKCCAVYTVKSSVCNTLAVCLSASPCSQ
jgi:hypothetical protein